MEPEPIFPGFEEVALPEPSGVPNLHNSDFVWPEKMEKMNHGLAKVLPPGHMSPTVVPQMFADVQEVALIESFAP